MPPGGSGAGDVATERVDPVVLVPGDDPTPGALRLAAVFPTVGRYAVSGQQSLNGVRLAVDEVNHEGGIHGRPLQLREYRTGSYFVDARHAAALAVDDGALAIVGANSSELSMAVAEKAEARGLVQVSNVSTAQDLTWDPESGRNRGFVFRVCSSDVVMGALLAEFAVEDLGARRAAVLYEVGREYSKKLARSFIDRFEETSGRAPREFFYLALETDFRPQLRLIAEYRPEVVFVPGSFTDATLIASQATDLGLTRHLPRRRRLVEPAALSPGRAAGGGVLHRAVLAVGGVRAAVPGRLRHRHPGVPGPSRLRRRAGRRRGPPLPRAAPRRRPRSGRRRHSRSRLRDAVAAAEVEGASGVIRFDAPR